MCDLSDPNIAIAYEAVTEGHPTNWFLLGYNDTRDVLSVVANGTKGLEELRNQLRNEIFYGFLRVENKCILITWISDQVSGVRRARALVHGRSVAAYLSLYQAQMTVSSLSELTEANIRTRLKLDQDSSPSARRAPPSVRKRPSVSPNISRSLNGLEDSASASASASTSASISAFASASASASSSASLSSASSSAYPAPAVVISASPSPSLSPPPQHQQQPVTPVHVYKVPEDNDDIFVDARETFAAKEKEAARLESERRRLLEIEEKKRLEELALERERENERKRRIAEVEQRRLAEKLERERHLAQQAEEARQRAAEEARQRAIEEAKVRAAKEEAKRRAEEEARVRALEEENRLKEQREQAALQARLREAERNEGVILVGFASFQPHTSPFWRRRFFVVRNQALLLYRDELAVTPSVIVDLKGASQLRTLEKEEDICLPNTFAINARQGVYHILGDTGKEAYTIMSALSTAVGGHA
ncbi:hypothetical protein J3Q64DRAFT_1823441 [Phycomyces blakesleeanus]|uniref:ADF-H domain-containing protein n=1 Tax=Phycomyces blakesleeanus TaxID=4837 RepID=A0ABR3ATW8_PHYBL